MHSLEEKYKKILLSFMSWKNGVEYEDTYNFSNEELILITPEDLVRWFQLKVYGTPDPSPQDMPTYGRSNSILYCKKAISFFMPNRLMRWNVMAVPPNMGNPTMSIAVNNLIKKVKKCEVRGHGKQTLARRPFEMQEFKKIIQLIEENDDEETRLFGSGIYRYQAHMMARIDDASKFYSKNLWENGQAVNYSLLNRLCWSKNVNDEREAPIQVLLGADDSNLCVLLGLSCWLEYSLEKYASKGEFIWNYHNLDDEMKIKSRANTLMKGVLKSPEFQNIQLTQGKVGTHSTRKMITTWVRRNGIATSLTNLRARWKVRDRGTQDTYCDPTLSYEDAKVAAACCKGGPITYQVIQSSGITEDWILTYVVPNISREFGRNVALVLGAALLWRIFDEDEKKVVPLQIKTRVIAAYNDLRAQHRGTLLEGENPVRKRLLCVYGEEDAVFIELLLLDDDNQNEQVQDRGGGGADHGNSAGETDINTTNNRSRQLRDEQMKFMNSQIIALRRENAELRSELARQSQISTTWFKTINRNVVHLMKRPTHFVARNTVTDADTVNHIERETLAEESREKAASLSKCPKNLHVLWQEFELGLGGRKPAKNFTAQERGGRNKHTYFRRNVFWKRVAEMVRGGIDSKVACDKIYKVYGESSSVTTILNQMKKDEMHGGHVSLRVYRH